MKHFRILLIIILLASTGLNAQDPRRFKAEIAAIETKYGKLAETNDLIVFTGSSSIQRWKNVNEYFPGRNIINTGFGGSQMSDLLYYSDTVIIKYHPRQVFIYEGDNDIASKKKPEEVLKDAENLIKKLTGRIPETQIIIISIKPSASRWKLKDEYIKLNDGYKNLSLKFRNVSFVDVWFPLLNESGTPKKEIFVSDSLHINSLGYDIWAKEIRKVIK